MRNIIKKIGNVKLVEEDGIYDIYIKIGSVWDNYEGGWLFYPRLKYTIEQYANKRLKAIIYKYYLGLEHNYYYTGNII